jgi:ubiquinone/menaquinone biosynthesis C-methylase UbiE
MPHSHPPGAGKSSYDLIDDHPRFWSALLLESGMTVLDLGCGEGLYAREIANRLHADGRLIAVDLWETGVARINQWAQNTSCAVEAHVADAGSKLPVADQNVDLCLMATVLHDLVHDGTAQTALKEVARVLKPSGILAIIEFKKQDGPPGPPRAVRLRLEEVSMLLMPVGLLRFGPVVDLGPDLWFSRFRRLSQKC